MTQRALPRVVLLPAVRSAKFSLLRGSWRSRQLAEFLAEAETLDLRFRGFRDSNPAADGRSDVVLVFDHWNDDFLSYAWPVLQDLDGSFAIAAATAGIGQRHRHLLADSESAPAWSQLRRLMRVGVDIVSAGHEGYDLMTLESEVVYGELLRSRCEFERRLGISPIALRYPFGRVDRRVAAVAADAGFEFGITPRGAVEGEALRCPVLRPRPLESPARFARRVAGAAASRRSSHERMAQARG